MSVRKILLLVLALAVLPLFVLAQSSGKLVGTVVDKSTGEPLPGVNISIEGTQMGAATDVDGYFVILNVPVGVYDIRASFIGYGEVVLSGIRITGDKTTEANFQLEEAAIEGQAVVITAQKPLVEKHITQSVSLVTSEDLENIPVRGFASVIATQNSVVLQDGNIHIRGSRSDEVGYYIDGASSTDPLTNTQTIHIIQEAVEEFQVLAGGYTAEFGGANAGIIRTELKTGGSQYHFSADFQTDKFASEGEEFLGTPSFRHHVGVATLSGPISKNIRFFVAAENNFQGDRIRRFGKPFSFQGLVDGNPENPKVQAGTPDVVDYSYNGIFTPQHELDRWTVQGTLLFDYAPLQFRLSGSFSDESRQFNSFYEPDQTGNAPNTPVLNSLNTRTFDDVNTNTLLTGKLTYILSPKSLVEANISYFNAKLDREDSFLGNNWLAWWDSSAVSQATGGAVTYLKRFTPEPNYRFNGIFFARNGSPYNSYRLQKQNYISAAVNFTSQVNRHHEVKVGGDIRRYTLRRFVARPQAISNLESFNVNDITQIPLNAWINATRVNNYGFDIYGNEADDDVFDEATGTQTAQAPFNPVFGAFYIQDKIEYNDLIINAGLRLDYFDTKARRLRDITAPRFNPDTKRILPEELVEDDAKSFVSPRLGFSFPVSERTVFYMQYGRFIQMPELETMYAGVHRYNFEILQAGFSFQDPAGFALDPVKTTSYEIGFRQQLGEVAAFDLAGFYRNVRGQVQVDRIIPTIQGVNPFNTLVNSDFATTTGLEFSLNLRRFNRLQSQINYTLTRAEGTASTRTTTVGALEQVSQRPSVINPLDYAQTHRGSIILDYRFGHNDGGPILQNFGANLLFTFNSGHPYTFSVSEIGQAGPYTFGTDYMADPRARRAGESVNSSTTPWNFNVDLRLDKGFKVTEKLQATVYARVTNLFNTKNVINVFQATGSAEDDGFINNPRVNRSALEQNGGEQYRALYQAVNIDNGQAYWDQIGLQLFGNPRQIFFGIKLNY